jgi:aminopeptidase N
MKAREVLLIASMLLFSKSFALQNTPAASTNAYDVRHYELFISFDLEKKIFAGTIEITARALAPMHDFTLHASDGTLTIDSVKTNGRKLPFVHKNDLLSIRLLQEMTEQESLIVSIYYGGISNFHGEYDSGGVYFSSSDHLATISEPNFARTWFPCNDTPSDKATATLHITVPESLMAVSNGILKSTTRQNGTATYTWETRYPVATYLVSVAAAPYKEYSDRYTAVGGESMEIKYYAFPEDSQKALNDFSSTSKILGFFARTFCEYPFLNEKFGYAEVDGDLTMENQTICSIQKNAITGNKDFESVIVHETAHQWWGDLITPLHWGDIWLSEGFATYAEALYRESAYSVDSYRKYIEWLMSAKPGDYAGSVVNYSDTAFWSLFSQRVYSKGALVLHMLRGVVGDSAFFTLMRNYLNDSRLRYGNATTSDFITICEETYGGTLQWFFNEWLFTSVDSVDRPEYVCRWTTQPRGNTFDVHLEITQTAASKQLFQMPMNVTISTGQTEHTYRITDSLATQSFNFQLQEQPTAVAIDKENYVFKTVKMIEGN